MTRHTKRRDAMAGLAGLRAALCVGGMRCGVVTGMIRERLYHTVVAVTALALGMARFARAIRLACSHAVIACKASHVRIAKRV